MYLVKVTFKRVEEELHKRSFGVLGTVSRGGRSHSVGILYGVSPPNKPLILYIMTDKKSKKAGNIANNPNVSFTIPLFRRLLQFIPPNCIQFQGTAEIIPIIDEGGQQAFRGSMVLREMLRYAEKYVQDRSEICSSHVNGDMLHTHSP